MGGFFGVVSKEDCMLDVFFGVDYHSHLAHAEAVLPSTIKKSDYREKYTTLKTLRFARSLSIFLRRCTVRRQSAVSATPTHSRCSFAQSSARLQFVLSE